MYTDTKRTAVILGCSKTVWSDYKQVQEKYKENELIHFAVNDIGMQFNKAPIDHIVSYHSDFASHIKSLYKIRFLRDVTAHGYSNYDNVDIAWRDRLENIGGTSSLFAVEIALDLGIRNIIVCGVSLDDEGHYYEEESYVKFSNTGDERIWYNKFDTKRKEQRQFVKVVSGKLKEYFGGIDGE